MHVVERDFSCSVHHDGPELRWRSAFSLDALYHCICALFNRLAVLLAKVFDELLPSFLSLGTAHEVVDAWVRIAGNFLVDVAELELRAGDVQSIKSGVHSSQPCINVFGVELGQVGLSTFLLACMCSCDGCFHYGCRVFPVVSSAGRDD